MLCRFVIPDLLLPPAHWCCRLLAIAFAFQPSTAPAEVVTLGASKDTSLYQNNVNNSSGGGNAIFAGTNGDISPRRALIAFDVADSIPAGATITDVQLTLFLGQVAGSGMGGGGGNSTIELHRLLADWNEGTTQQQNPPNDSFATLGQGAPAANGDATWNARMFPATLWTNPGGDFVPMPSATLSVGSVLNAPYVWGSTGNLVSDVQQWLSTPASNFGWELVNADETTARNFRAFYSRETATAALHPQLQITYTDAAIAGDFNSDGRLTSADIPAMIAALTDLHAYQSAHNLSDAALLGVGDVDQNHVVNNADLQALLGKLNSDGDGAATVPEPATLLLLVTGGISCLLLVSNSPFRLPNCNVLT
jgi:hypothetical protein